MHDLVSLDWGSNPHFMTKSLNKLFKLIGDIKWKI